jgi:tRNA-Thr(GGU) m(6)t(6)A37 methyltransferase TsaA
MEGMTMGRQRVEELEKQIADLKRRWPRHSVPPALMEQLDELEEELSRELDEIREPDHATAPGSKSLHLRAIGRVENEFDQPAAPEEISAVESRIIIDPTLVLGLQGLEPGQQIMVLFYFDRSDGFELLQYPRGDSSRPKSGVFSLRSPRRPNPIGVTVVDLIAIEGNVLRVRGLDALDNTPVLDLKLA